jgi:HJR/Mrr/RecB family endonuclease
MSGRVDWGSRDGNEVEAVIANLLYNEDGRAVRVRPGQGDFGIDVILPAAEEAELWDVCQVKKYAANLNSTEKNKIVESFSRLLIGLVLPRQPCRIRYRRLPARRTSKGRRL